MPDHKYPEDGEMKTEEGLVSDKDFRFPSQKPVRCIVGISFEIKITGATALDDGVSFKIYSGLCSDVLSSVNKKEAIQSVELTGKIGDLIFERYLNETIDTHYFIVISGTDPSSTATFLIRARC